eukprot:scaffold1085_cov407-Prasinococcus_capsulatus_cf.AAC.83
MQLRIPGEVRCCLVAYRSPITHPNLPTLAQAQCGMGSHRAPPNHIAAVVLSHIMEKTVNDELPFPEVLTSPRSGPWKGKVALEVASSQPAQAKYIAGCLVVEHVDRAFACTATGLPGSKHHLLTLVKAVVRISSPKHIDQLGQASGVVVLPQKVHVKAVANHMQPLVVDALHWHHLVLICFIRHPHVGCPYKFVLGSSGQTLGTALTYEFECFR